MIFLTTHYVSLGCMCAYVLFVIETFIFGMKGMLGTNLSSSSLLELNLIAVFLMCLAVFQHRKNVVRLIKGEENKTFLSKKGKEEYQAKIEAAED